MEEIRRQRTCFFGNRLFVPVPASAFAGVLPCNPQNIPGTSWHLAFNTASSFVTNTNWQAYSGESTLSYLTQALGLTVQNFVSAATGIAVLFALIRGFSKVKETGFRAYALHIHIDIMFISVSPRCVVSRLIRIGVIILCTGSAI